MENLVRFTRAILTLTWWLICHSVPYLVLALTLYVFTGYPPEQWPVASVFLALSLAVVALALCVLGTKLLRPIVEEARVVYEKRLGVRLTEDFGLDSESEIPSYLLWTNRVSKVLGFLLAHGIEYGLALCVFWAATQVFEVMPASFVMLWAALAMVTTGLTFFALSVVFIVNAGSSHERARISEVGISWRDGLAIGFANCFRAPSVNM